MNLITTESIQCLKAKKSKLKLVLNGVGGASNAIIRGIAQLTIYSTTDQTVKITAQFLVINKITTDLPTSRLDNAEWHHLNDIQLADDKYHVPSRMMYYWAQT